MLPKALSVPLVLSILLLAVAEGIREGDLEAIRRDMEEGEKRPGEVMESLSKLLDDTKGVSNKIDIIKVMVEAAKKDPAWVDPTAKELVKCYGMIEGYSLTKDITLNMLLDLFKKGNIAEEHAMDKFRELISLGSKWPQDGDWGMGHGVVGNYLAKWAKSHRDYVSTAIQVLFKFYVNLKNIFDQMQVLRALATIIDPDDAKNAHRFKAILSSLIKSGKEDMAPAAVEIVANWAKEHRDHESLAKWAFKKILQAYKAKTDFLFIG